MSKTSTKDTAKLGKMKVNELQAMFADVTGERTRSPNKTFLVRRITEALQAKEGEGRGAKAKDTPAGAADPLPPEKLTKLDVPALQARYLEVVGRPSGSSSKAYLVWKIREAQKGRVRIGARKSAHREGVTFKVLPLRMESDLVDKLDEAWRSKGIKSRTDFLRAAIGLYLGTLGAAETAALFGDQDARVA